MAFREKTPFSFNFSCPEGTATIGPKRIMYSRALLTIGAYVEDDNKGPVLIDIYIIIEGNKYPIVQDVIFDGEGHNAKRLNWNGFLPLSKAMPNELYVIYANYSGEDIDAVRITGVLER